MIETTLDFINMNTKKKKPKLKKKNNNIIKVKFSINVSMIA